MDVSAIRREPFYPAIPPPQTSLQPTLGQLEYLAHHCRNDERVQACALNGWQQYDAAAHARDLAGRRGATIIHFDADGLPTCAGGFVQDQAVDGVWRGWACGTQAGWDAHWRSITKATAWMVRALMESTAHRLEVEVVHSRVGAMEWYERSLGFLYEGRRRGFTVGGEDLYLYSMTSKDWNQHEERIHGRRQ